MKGIGFYSKNLVQRQQKWQGYNHCSLGHTNGCQYVARRVSAMSANLTEQLYQDLSTCKWFSIQCDESVDSSNTVLLMGFVRIVSSYFSAVI